METLPLARFMRLFRFKSGSDDFLPSVTTLMSGTTLAMGLTYIARPVLTRLYTPEMFGILGVFTALVAVLTTISSGRYDDAVMLPEDDDQARNVFTLGLSILIALSVLTIPVAVFNDAIAGSIGKPQLAPYLVLLPFSLLCAGLARLLESWLTREKRFRAVAAGRASQSATSVPIQLTAGLQHVGPWGLVAGLVAGQAAAAGVLAALSRRRLLDGAVPQLADLKRIARRFRDFPFFSGPSALLNSTSTQLPAFLLFFFFDATVVGHYAQAYALLAVPIGLVGSSVAQVYFVKAARCKLEGGLDVLTRGVFRRLVEVGLFPMLVVLVAGPQLIGFVLGPDWTTAGVYAQWLAVWLLFVFISSPLTRLFDVLEKLRANLAFNVALFSLRAIALSIGGVLGKPLVAIALYGAGSAVMYAGLLVWLLRLAQVDIGLSLRFLGRSFLTALIPVLMVVGVSAYGATSAVIFGTACLAGLVYAGIVIQTYRSTADS
ncbi:MAG: oligosaccharide flippase family protein [Rhodothermales bacterium]